MLTNYPPGDTHYLNDSSYLFPQIDSWVNLPKLSDNEKYLVGMSKIALVCDIISDTLCHF
jgi:hypothetical protein